jgi:hypothetical protein
VVEEAVADDFDVGLRAAEDDAAAQLVGGHLKAEIQGRDAAADHVLAHVEHQRGFAHRGTAGDDGELSWA